MKLTKKNFEIFEKSTCLFNFLCYLKYLKHVFFFLKIGTETRPLMPLEAEDQARETYE